MELVAVVHERDDDVIVQFVNDDGGCFMVVPSSDDDGTMPNTVVGIIQAGNGYWYHDGENEFSPSANWRMVAGVYRDNDGLTLAIKGRYQGGSVEPGPRFYETLGMSIPKRWGIEVPLI